MLGGSYYGAPAAPRSRGYAGRTSGSPNSDRASLLHGQKKKRARGPFCFFAESRFYVFRIRSSSALPIAWVRFTTFSLRRIFCTWFFTVSGLILRMAPISKFDLPR